MAVVGMWIAVVGYGLAYAGWVKLSGGQCGIVQAFQGKCSSAKTQAATQGQTTQGRLLAQQQQQAAMIGTQPIPQVA